MKKETQPFKFDEMDFEKAGERVFIKAVEGENLTFLNCKFEKGCKIPNHHHKSEQMTYIVKGCLKGSVNGKEYIVRTGEGIIIAPDVPHEWIALEETISLEAFSPPREKPNFRT